MAKDMTAPDSQEFERQQRSSLYSIAVICYITISSAAYGYAGAVIATTLTQPSFHEAMGLTTAPNADSLIGAMNALYYAGGIFGSFLAGWTSRTYGRKFSVAMGNLLLLISGALLCGSVNPAMFIVFRFVSGVGSFQILSSVPLWIGELAPPKIRGIITDIHAVVMLLGYTISIYVGLGFYFVSGTNQWRGPLGLQMVLPTIVLCGIYWMPESPRYLLSKAKVEQAWAIIHHMHSDPSDPNDEFAKREFYQIRKQIELDITFATSYVEIFKKPSLRKRAFMTIFLEFCLMSSGILVVLNYGSIIYATLGFDTVQILNFQGGFQLTGFVFNIAAMGIVDRIPRNKLISLGLLSCSITVSILTALQSHYIGTTERSGLIACVAMIFLFQTVYSFFLDGATFFYLTEIWPSHLRAQGFGIGMATLSLTNLMWLQAAPHAFISMGWKFYLFFIIITGIGAVVVFLFFPDTLHKPLEEIAALFGDEDTVVVYQRDLDHSAIPIDEIEEVVPGAKSGGGVVTNEKGGTAHETTSEELEHV